MQLSKLTFSLASLVLIFALAFAALPAMAAPGGPTVTSITAYSGKVLTDAGGGVAALGTDDYVATRADFRVKITLSHGVTRNASVEIQARAGNASGVVGAAVNATTPLELPNTDGKEFVVQFDLSDSTLNTATSVAVNVQEDAFTGDTLGNFLGSQARISGALTLPPLNATVTASFGDPAPVANILGRYTVTVTFDSGQTATALTLSPAFTNDYIEVSPQGGATVTIGGVDSTVVGKLSYPLTVQLGFGVTETNPATISIPSGYVKGGASITLPPVEQDPPSVRMRVPSHDPASREFRLEVTFTPGRKSNGQPGDPVTVGPWLGATNEDFRPSTHLKFTDATNVETPPSLVGDRASNNSYVAIFKYSVLDTLPITITTVDGFETSDNPRTSVMVGAGPGTPQPPPSGITFSPNQIPNQRFVVNTPITPLTLPVATGGTSPYTYTLAPRPAGLLFNSVPAARELSGTPTTVGTTATTYTARDSGGRTATLTFTIEVVAAGTPSSIPDANLAAAIRRSLSLPANTPLTTALMAQLTNLNAYGSSVAQLNGLEQATNLTTLDLGMNRITSISTLASLTKLTHLYLDDNQITNVSPLVGLRNLRLLRLAGNPIQDTSPLATLIQQNPGLDLDIPPIPPQTGSVTFADPKLETAVRIALRMSASEVITREAMLGLVFLEAYDRRIESIQGLQHATNLIALDLGKNAVVNISPLSGLTKLQILFLDDNQIVDVSPLAGLTQLDLLFLTGNPISSLAPISHLIDGIQIIRTRADH